MTSITTAISSWFSVWFKPIYALLTTASLPFMMIIGVSVAGMIFAAIFGIFRR